MKRQLIRITLLFIILITVAALFLDTRIIDSSEADWYREQLVDLNEIVKLSNQVDEESNKKLELALKEFKAKQADMKEEAKGGSDRRTLWFMYACCICFLLFVFSYIYYTILRPFDKLQSFAEEIAKGNFDLDLKYERINYFGKFTWAFDHMRREITKARACEKEAIENNKTVIATLSHDIKTPIASIRAYSEGLDANLDSGPEMRRKYSEVILKKCDEVTKLTEDLFLHSLSDLDKLKIHMEKVNLPEIMLKLLPDLNTQESLVTMTGEIPDVWVMLDVKRFEQVLENLINNATKYASQGRIDLYAALKKDNIIITVHDYGQGIPDEDMPFVFDKFYRGKNVGDRQGSGLGLYIVRYIMEQMDGSVSLRNSGNGLQVNLTLPYCS